MSDSDKFELWFYLVGGLIVAAIFFAMLPECGHFSRRWKSLFSRTDFARLCEEVHADRVAMALTGATLDDLDAVVRQLASYEESWSPETLESYVEQRRSLLQSLETSVPAR